jgi:hypothetical protein
VREWGNHEYDRRFDLAGDINRRQIPAAEARLKDAQRRRDLASDDGPLDLVDHLQRTEVDPILRELTDLDARAEAALRDPHGRIEVPEDVHLILNTDYAEVAPGGVTTDGVSALTGTGHPPPVETDRPYWERGGYRQPLVYDQVVLERLVPRDASGRPQRQPNPLLEWFGKLNDSGPLADPTRGINCVDCVLSLFDLWMHGRARVAAPRTFDAYLDGDVRQPLDGEAGGLARVQRTLGAPPVTLSCFDDLHRALSDAGPGAFAVITTEWRDGGSHTWAAVNHDGTDPVPRSAAGLRRGPAAVQHRGPARHHPPST